jgi:ATP-dependent DNA ligase
VSAGDAWLHEPKLDGYRLQVGTGRLAGLAEVLRGIPARSVIIDAEMCLPDMGGAPNF